MNSSSASIATGVRSFQLKGMPVAIGVVKRFDSVMMILCGLLREFLTSRKPSPPAPPALLITTIGCFIRLCLLTMPWMVRAIWSAPPPVPAGIMNSTGRVGSHAAWAVGSWAKLNAAVPSASSFHVCLMVIFLSLVPSPAIVLAVKAESDEIRTLATARHTAQEYIITHYTHLACRRSIQTFGQMHMPQQDLMLRRSASERASVTSSNTPQL